MPWRSARSSWSLLAQLAGSASSTAKPAARRLQRAASGGYAEILPIRDDDGTVRLDVEKIDWIDAAGDYMCVHAEAGPMSCGKR